MGIVELLTTYGDLYLSAFLLTWGMTLLSYAVAMVLAVIITVMRVSPIKPLRIVGDLYVQVFRNIPGVSLLFILFYALPYLNLTMPAMTCVIVATILLVSAFGSENFMTGINAIGVGQIEAARSIGLTFGQTMRHIVIPQALRTAVLPMTNLLIACLLTTAIGALLTMRIDHTIYRELTGVVSYLNDPRRAVGVMAFVVSAVLYAGSSLLIGFVGNRIDKKVRVLR